MRIISRPIDFYQLVVVWCLGMILLINTAAHGQVDQNMPVPPQKTSCDSISWWFEDMAEGVKAIENATFRFQQNITTTRSSGFQSVHYYSCDHKYGFMIVRIDNEKTAYREVPLFVWEGFTETKDLEHFYADKIINLMLLITEKY